MNDLTETHSDLARIEARMIRTAVTDAEWEELVRYRPRLPDALEAYERERAARHGSP